MCPVHSEAVKKCGEEIEYTQEMIQELIKCKNDILHFINYVKIITIDSGKIHFNPYDFQKEILSLIANNRFVILKCARQTGKCVYKQSYIKIKNKITGEIEEIDIESFFNKFSKK